VLSGGQQICWDCPHWQSQPFAVLPSQFPKPIWHVENVHEPELQVMLFAFWT